MLDTSLNLKVLIIEDDNFLSDLYKMQFEKNGYKVVQSYDGLDGLSKVAIETPSVVVLDLILPEFTGLEVLERLNKDSKLSRIPVVVLSSLRDEKKIKEALALGAVGYIIKPTLTPKQVVEEVSKYIRKQN